MLHILTYIPRFSVGILVYANTNPSPHSIHKTAEIDVKTLNVLITAKQLHKYEQNEQPPLTSNH
jgi:hypothetical protein